MSELEKYKADVERLSAGLFERLPKDSPEVEMSAVTTALNHIDKLHNVLKKIANARGTCYSTGEALSKAMFWARDAIGLTEAQVLWTQMDRVTITGADDSIDPNALALMSKEYPFVEWGILFGTHPGNPRFPGSEFRHQLAKVKELNPKMKLSAHLCGRFVRDLVELGNLSFKTVYPYLWQHFERFQINFHGQWHKISKDFLDILPEFKGKQVIFQIDGINDDAWRQCADKCDAVPFFDASHGAGVMPEKWPEPMFGFFNGYSGGLGPENLTEEIPKISLAAGGAAFWIDMETKVRGIKDTTCIKGPTDVFDLVKVKACLEAAAPFIAGKE